MHPPIHRAVLLHAFLPLAFLLLALPGATAPARAADEAPLFEVAGTVRDSAGHPLAGAVVLAGGIEARSAADGSFRLRLPPGTHTLRAQREGLVPAERVVEVSGALRGVDLVLAPFPLAESVVVRAIRAGDETPVTRTELDRAEIERASYGQELPFLLAAVPSVTQYSDAGMGAGYSYLFLRGIQHTRINMTFDGVPLNEPEDSAAYTVNYANLAASLDSIQLQRGVGTSTFGAAAYAGSISLRSVDPAADEGVSLQAGAGSFDTRRVSLGWNSGEVGGRYRLYARLTHHETDGYRDRSGVTQQSAFFGMTARGAASSLKVSGFIGREETQLAFYAVEPWILEENPRFNYLTDEDRDEFAQGLVQATWTRALSADASVSVQGYYHGAGGWYRIVPDEYGLDWGFGGLAASYTDRLGTARVTFGAHANDYASRHTREPIGGAREYENRGHKGEQDVFAKIEQPAGRATLFADAQYRRVRFRYEGAWSDEITWSFFNPKLGVRVAAAPGLALYASVGSTEREPTRSDLFSGADNPPDPVDLGAVRPERVVDVEAGAEWNVKGLALGANVYAMEFHNEIALTGELSEVGLPLRRNVDRSYRRGLELEAAWQATPRLRATLVANLSRNRIESWTQYYDGGALVYEDVEPLLTPAFSGNAGLEYALTPALTIGANARHVEASYLDNTNQDALRTPAFTLVDAQLLWTIGPARLRLRVDNLLDEDRAWPSGYSWLYPEQDAQGNTTLAGVPYFYPLASRSVFAGLEWEL